LEFLDFKTVSQLCGSINFNEERPKIDLRRIKWISPFALVYLGLFLRYHNRNGIYFDLVYPEAEKVRKFLGRQDFNNRFNIIDQEIVTHENSNPLIYSFELVDVTREMDLADRTVSKIADLLHRNRVHVPIEEFCLAVSELVDNFALHAKIQTGVMMLQLYPRKKSIYFIIGDYGIGIRESLSQNPQYSYLKERPHLDAIRKAIEFGVSRFEGRGTGFYDVIDTVTRWHGSFTLVSHDGYLKFDGEKYLIGQMGYQLPGVQVEFTLQETK
jgi:hypothetical protein